MTKFLILYRKKVVKSESYSLSRPPFVYAEFVSQSTRKKADNRSSLTGSKPINPYSFNFLFLLFLVFKLQIFCR